jgi:phosphomevalonate kinase
MIVTAPGNILVLGEYAVLEEGGLGVACAVLPRCTAEISADHADTQSTPEPSLFRCCRDAVESHLKGCMSATNRKKPSGLDRPGIRLDTSGFLDPETGKKTGLGSSAAGAVAVCAGLLAHAYAESGRPVSREIVFRTALEAHRAFQGGKGSGYDVAASTCGGVRLFTGGADPVAGKEILWHAGPFELVSVYSPVQTGSAVEAYRTWKKTHPGAAREFLNRSNRLVLQFVAARSRQDALEILFEAARAGVELGEAIGVPARPQVSNAAVSSDRTSGLDPTVTPHAENRYAVLKAVGAGAELMIGFPREYPGTHPDGNSILPCTEGAEWKE